MVACLDSDENAIEGVRVERRQAAQGDHVLTADGQFAVAAFIPRSG